MEFDELKKVWDEQNNETLYVLNEEAIHKSVKKKKAKANRLVNIDEIGLTVICILTGSYIMYEAVVDNDGFLFYLGGIMMILIGLYVLYMRSQRRKEEKKFDRSILGEIDHAIASTQANIKLGVSMVWWYFCPMAIWIVVLFSTKGVEWYYWVGITGMFALAHFIARLGINHHHRPRLAKLQEMKKKLEEEV